MITRETVIDEIQNIPEPYLVELYKIIKDFEVAKKKPTIKCNSLMYKLRNIKIHAPSDFSLKADLYTPGDNKNE